MKVYPGWENTFMGSCFCPRSRARRTTRSDIVHKIKLMRKRRRKKGYR